MTHKTCPACGNGLDDNGDHFYCPGCCQAFTPEQVASGVVRQPDGACIFAASYEILAELLRLPPGVRIIGIHDESWNGSVDIAIRGPGLPACEQGACLPRARAIVTTQCVPVATRFDPVEDEVITLRAEVARLRKLVEDDGK